MSFKFTKQNTANPSLVFEELSLMAMSEATEARQQLLAILMT